MIFQVAFYLGILPILWLIALDMAGRRLPSAWWWMAGAFGISWLADFAAHFVPAPLISQVYPVTQGALMAAVFVPVPRIHWVVTGLLLAASVSVGLRDGQGLDVLLHVLAWGTVAALAWRYTAGSLRGALVAAFGGGAVAWMGYVAWPGWASWLTFQGTRVVGAVWWMWAAWQVPLTQEQG